MIRFVDLGDQLLYGEPHFTWFDTVFDEFVEYGDDQIWDSWDDFEHSFHADDGSGQDLEFDAKRLARFKQLFPKDWPAKNQGFYNCPICGGKKYTCDAPKDRGR